MTSPTEAFFDKLRHTARIPSMAKVNGSIRFEVTDGKKVEKTRIDVVRGNVTVGEPTGDAQCWIYVHRDVLDALCTQEAQPMTAYLRGALVAKGDAAMLVLMRRLFSVAGVPELATGRPKLISAPRAAVAARTAPASRRTTQAVTQRAPKKAPQKAPQKAKPAVGRKRAAVSA